MPRGTRAGLKEDGGGGGASSGGSDESSINWELGKTGADVDLAVGHNNEIISQMLNLRQMLHNGSRALTSFCRLMLPLPAGLTSDLQHGAVKNI